MRQRQFTIIPRQLMKANDLRRVVSIITLAMMMALALPPDSSARSSGSHSTSHRSSSAGYSHAARTPSTGKAAPSSASDRALSRQTSKGALTALRAADAARKASTAVVLPPSSQSRRPSTTHHRSRGLFDRVDLDLDDVVEAVVPLFTTRAPTVVVVNNAPNAAATAAAVPIAAATTAAVAAAPAAAAPTATSIAASAGSVLSAIVTGLIMLLLIGGLIGAVVLWWLWRRRSRSSGTASTAAARPSARSHLFRVGMTLPVDPSLFILAAPYTTVTAPEAATASGFLSVEQVGRVEGSGQTWYRLYVASGTGFFQVHLDAAGQPDECRYFSQLDEVAPADAEEWRIWLDQADGLLGRPTFATKDGQHYQRHWSPGTTRIAPHLLTETLEPAGGAMRHEQAMLYARLTAAPAPAPPTEYLLVQAIEQPDAAWIALQVGIDIPLAALQLS